ncbi:Fic family protein [Nocardia uniformis]|uniref:Fic family protein n=1 Tax=Nocardia uniformis TaxID=53432 RepID=A0A849BYU4_9NOCA|nr:Fic family protein [Nocardia uniformis]NNH70438.1 Fic family protein [Nocardia uniformis]
MFQPNFTISPAAATSLMAIEADRQAIMELPINVDVLAGLRETARLAATHYSTQIEGNRLTQAQVAEALAGAHFPGRERDEAEVRNYYRALEHIESLAIEGGPINELELRRVHGFVMTGKRTPTPTPYRPGQNVIREAANGRVVYMPPEAPDVPELMSDLFEWINTRMAEHDLPAPLVAALTHYQYATIHPYDDGNGRTARLLTTLVLHRAGYGLKGIYSLDEHYARNLADYYTALTVGPSHNYYLGRAEADLTGFLNFFCDSMAQALGSVRTRVTDVAQTPGNRHTDDTAAMRQLDPRQRRTLELFRDSAVVTSSDIATQLGISPRTANTLIRNWNADDFLAVDDPSKKKRTYRLRPRYERLVSP